MSAKRLPTCGRYLPTFWQVLAGWVLQALLRFLVCNHPVRARGISVTADQQAAGAVMKVLGGAYLWTLIGIRFFRWSAAQRRIDEQDRRARFAAEQLTTADVEAALAKAGPPPIEP